VKTEQYFTWREYVQVEGEDSPRLLVPWSDPNKYEFPFDFLYASEDAAREGLEIFGAQDDAKEWVLCKLTLEPVSPAPTTKGVSKVKLVRDLIPQIIEGEGRECEWRRVSDPDEHLSKLSEKMREEVAEFVENPSYEEAADMLEVLLCLCSIYGLTFGSVERTAQAKRAERGGFDGGVVLLEYKDLPAKE